MTTLRNGNDAYVAESTPSRNYSNSVNLVCKTGAGTQFQSYIYFALPPATYHQGVTILDAKLKLYLVSPETATHTINVRRITTLSWLLSTINWSNKPVSTTTNQATVVMSGTSAVGRELVFDVTAMMQVVSDGGAYGGFHIVNDINDYLYLGSTQHATYKPVLEITWSDDPIAPSTLSPSGNRAVALAKPVLRFDFTDVAGSTQLQSVQVQINATNVWTAPSFDSGTVATTTPQLDLATTAYAGLTAGSSTWWRVRVQDGAGLWSDWSNGAQFQRQNKSTLTITNPPVSGLITEPTPPITWTFGGTQTAWQVYVTPANATSSILYNTGKVAGTALAHTLPDGVLKDDSSYTLFLRVWDNVSREATPGDTAWVEASRNFTYSYDAATAAVTSLAATDLTPVPGVTLTWSRSTAPDSFAIRRDGKIIASNLLPGTLSTGGTNYAYTDRAADPRKAVTWRVDAIVNGKTSNASPTVTKTLNPIGTWLQDPSRGIAVRLLGREPGTWAMGETAATYNPIGGTKGVRVTQSLRGFEGSVQGTIMAGAGISSTVAQQVTDFLALKATAGRIYLLTPTGSDFTITVVCGNMVAAPVPSPAMQRAVSFDFWATEAPFTAVL